MTKSLKALVPPIAWRQQPPYTPPPPGYKLEIYRSASAAQTARVWGVRPVHIGMCTYALWVPINTPAPNDSPLRHAVAEWLEAGGKAAAHVAGREYPFGRERILAYAEELGCPVPATYASRMQDLEAFLRAAREA